MFKFHWLDFSLCFSLSKTVPHYLEHFDKTMARMVKDKGRGPIFLYFWPIFFGKLNLWLPKQILHLVPLKIFMFCPVIMVYFFHELTIQRGEGSIKEVIKCYFQSCFDSCRYLPKTLQTKCKTCFGGLKSYWNTQTKT